MLPGVNSFSPPEQLFLFLAIKRYAVKLSLELVTCLRLTEVVIWFFINGVLYRKAAGRGGLW